MKKVAQLLSPSLCVSVVCVPNCATFISLLSLPYDTDLNAPFLCLCVSTGAVGDPAKYVGHSEYT